MKYIYTVVLGALFATAPAAAQDDVLLGRYATPDGSVLTLRKSGTNLTGELFSKHTNSIYQIQGQNSIPGQMKMDVLDASGDILSSGEYLIGRKLFSQGSDSVGYTTWQKKSGPDSILNEFAAIISAEDKNINIKLSDDLISLTALVNHYKLAQAHFKSREIEYNYDIGNLISTDLLNDNELFSAKVNRVDLSDYLALEWERTGELPRSPSVGGIRFQTVGKTEAIASISAEQIGSIIQNSIAGNSNNTSADIPISISVKQPKSLYRNIRAKPPNELMKAFTDGRDHVRNLIAPWLESFGPGKCKVEDTFEMAAIACDYHWSRYKNSTEAWMQTYISFVSIPGAGNTEELLILPSSVVAKGFFEVDYDKLKSDSFNSIDSISGSLGVQDAFIDSFVAYVIDKHRFVRQ